MVFYDNITAVQSAYLEKATADKTQCPKQIVSIGGKIVASSTGTKPFFHAMSCPVAITGRVKSSDIKDGKVKDEAPIYVTSDTGDFFDGAKQLYCFVSPGLGEDSLKPTSIQNDSLFGTAKLITLKAGHNFAIKSTATPVYLYRSVIDGQLYEEDSLPEQTQSKCLEKYTAEVKAERNARIADTDDLAKLDDMTIKVSADQQRRALTSDERTALIEYRQALRDLPEAEGFPFVSFPEIPEALSLYLTEKINSRAQMALMGGM